MHLGMGKEVCREHHGAACQNANIFPPPDLFIPNVNSEGTIEVTFQILTQQRKFLLFLQWHNTFEKITGYSFLLVKLNDK